MENRVADNDACLNERLDRARFRAWRRGFREADLVLGPFAEQVGPTLDDAGLAEFEALLDVEDQYLYGWIIGRDETPPEHDGPVMARIRAFMHEHVAAAVARGAG
jgi:antitoxin CptB